MASNDFVISTNLIVLGGVDFSGGSGSGNILATNVGGYALLDEAASAINPTLIPNRLNLITGIGGVDDEGADHLHLIVESDNMVDITTASMTLGGDLILPDANSFISLGPNASATGDIRFGNTRFIAWRNMNNNGDVQALSVDEDDFLNIGSAAALRSRILSPSFVVLTVGPHTIGTSAPQNHRQLRLVGNFVSGGQGTSATNFHMETDLTGFSGDTTFLAGFAYQGAITTQAVAEAITNVSSMHLDEPAIALGAGSSVTNAQTLLIFNAPTEGDANYALRVQSGNVLFQGLQLGVGVSSNAGIFQVEIGGNFGSDGGNVFATNFRVAPGLVGAAGDTDSLMTARFEGNISTQAATESITNIAQVRIADGIITDNLTGGGLITNAQILLLEGTPIEGVNNFSLRSLGTAPSLFAGLQFFIGDTASPNHRQVLIAGTFTSGGASTESSKFRVEGTMIGAPGDTSNLTGVHFNLGITTQTATESISDISTVRIEEPFITDNLTGSILNASNLLIVGSPTEGDDNFSLKSTGAARSLFVGLQFTIGTSVVQDLWQVQIRGNFTSGGQSNRAAKFEISDNLTGFSGDTVFLAGAVFEANITTQAVAEVIVDVAQVLIAEPVITLGAGSSVTNAQTLLISGAPTEGVNNYALRVASGDVILGGNLAVSGAGPHSIAGVTFGAVQLLIGSTFTSDGASDIAAGLFHTPAIVGAPGDTSALTGTTLTAGITTQTATESIANIAQLQVNEPFITDNLTGDITLASTVLITGAPTEGLANYALRVVSGATFLGGELEHAGSTLGFFGTSPTTQPAAYTRNATIVEDRTLLASASATALNNNNVLAALIADLQSLGVIG